MQVNSLILAEIYYSNNNYYYYYYYYYYGFTAPWTEISRNISH